MEMDMVLADHSFEDLYIIRITDLFDEISYACVWFSLKNFITIFCDPHYVSCEAVDRVCSVSILVGRHILIVLE